MEDYLEWARKSYAQIKSEYYKNKPTTEIPETLEELNDNYKNSVEEEMKDGLELRDGTFIEGKDILAIYKKYRRDRKEICLKCEYNSNSWCKKCGCFLPLKISAPITMCPVGKWIPMDKQYEKDLPK